MAAVGVGLFFLVFFAAMVTGVVFWIMKIVEVAQIPEPQYRAAGTDKTVWVLVVVLVGWVGALIWQFAKRDDVLRARGLVPPPGWGAGYLPPGPGHLPPGPGYNPSGGGYLPAGPGYHPQTPGYLPQTPAGWYPEPGTGWAAYWDGYRWTGARRPPEGPSGTPPGTGSAMPPGTGPGPSLEKRPD